MNKRAVDADRWDLQDLHAASKAVRPFARARRRLRDEAESGAEALDDVFWVLYKADPRLVDASTVAPSHRINHAVISQLWDLAPVRRLRGFTVGDSVQGALGAADLEPALEGIFERLGLEQLLADQLQAAFELVEVREIEVSEATDALDALLGDDPSPEDFREALEASQALAVARDALAAAKLEADRLDGELRLALEREAASIRHDLTVVVTGAADEARVLDATGLAYGLQRGELQRLPPAQRLERARQLKSPKMQRIAELFGRIRNLAFSQHCERVEGLHEEIVDLEMGGDLSRLAPSEMMLLGDPVAELDFYARLNQRELLQFAVQGSDELGQGGIIACVDSSGSMMGEREIWAKAVMLVLLHFASLQHREMHVIHFGSEGEFRTTSFTRPGDFSADKILDVTEIFLRSGTHFETPLRECLRLLRAERDRVDRTSADVVFITDGAGYLRSQFLAEYQAATAELGARTWAVSVEQVAVPVLASISDGRVMTVQDLSSGRDVASLLRDLRA